MSLTPPREKIEFAVVGRPKSWPIKVRRDGNSLDLTGLTVVAVFTNPSGTKDIAGTVSVTDAPDGEFTVTLSAANNATAGTWLLDVYIGAGGSEEPLNKLFTFTSYASQTEA